MICFMCENVATQRTKAYGPFIFMVCDTCAGCFHSRPLPPENLRPLTEAWWAWRRGVWTPTPAGGTAA